VVAVAATTAAADIDRPRQLPKRPLRRLFSHQIYYLFNSFKRFLTGR